MCSFIHIFWCPADKRYFLWQKMTKDVGPRKRRPGQEEGRKKGSGVVWALQTLRRWHTNAVDWRHTELVSSTVQCIPGLWCQTASTWWAILKAVKTNPAVSIHAHQQEILYISILIMQITNTKLSKESGKKNLRSKTLMVKGEKKINLVL